MVGEPPVKESRAGAIHAVMLRSLLTMTLLLCACTVEDDPAVGQYDGLTLIDGGATLEVDASWRQCEDVTPCVLVGTSCDDCCGAEAIAVERQSEYRDAFADLCEPYQGGVCDCAPSRVEVACIDDVCVLTEPEA